MFSVKTSAALAALYLLCATAFGANKMPLMVNSSHPLPQDYIPDELVEIRSTRNDGRPTQKMCKDAAEALDKMLDDLNAAFPDDVPVTVTSGYRSFKYQNYLFEKSVRAYISEGMDENDARSAAGRYTARAGESEHQSGLAADLHNLSSATSAFANTPQYEWLCENACKYGFILRYPKGKQQLTGIAFEPWHWRYVGANHAEKIKKAGICLEEYTKNS